MSSSRRSQRDSLRTQTPESEISSTCPFSPGNPGWDLPELNGLQPSNQIQNQAQTQTQTPESDISSTYPLSPGNPGNPPQDINNTMQEPTHRHQSPLPASSPHHSDFITSLSYTRVTGGGSPLPGRRSSLDLGRDFIPASTSIDHPSLSTSPASPLPTTMYHKKQAQKTPRSSNNLRATLIQQVHQTNLRRLKMRVLRHNTVIRKRRKATTYRMGSSSMTS